MMESSSADDDDAQQPQEGMLYEATLFAEYPQVLDCLSIVTTTNVESSSSSTDALEERTLAKDTALTQLRVIWDKYLECPTLLDPYLEKMVKTLAEYARDNLSDDDGNSTDHGLPHVLSALYALSKVCGRKRVQRFLPHEARDVEPVLKTLQAMDNMDNANEEQQASTKPWESIYVLWLWLGKLSLVPFDCRVLDDSDGTLVASLISLAKQHLSHAGPTRETAASCLASWLSRPDLEQTGDLQNFVNWSNQVLSSTTTTTQDTDSDASTDDVFLVMGVVQTLANIIKKTDNRSNILHVMEPLWECMLLVSDSIKGSSKLLLRKLLAKWFARMGCAHLPPRVASWRYARGRRSLLQNMEAVTSITSPSVTGKGSAAESDISATLQENKEEFPQEENDELFYVPDEVEDATGQLIKSLTDSSTVVRWSAAKGVGRITERLPSVCAHDVLDAVVELFLDEDRDHAWHGACLALAELARRGLLLPNRLGDVVPLVVRAIQYDVRRGPTSVGSHVRDAACYTYWAFARAYAPSVLKPYIPQLSQSIVVAFLFDREVNCRRAASAAFQECVGRQGADHFKHGISILTAADYFTLGNRNDAYTSVAYHVAQFPEYRVPIIRHLYTVKLFHWDARIRALASKSLNGLTFLDVAFMTGSVVPFLLQNCTDENLFVRHGAVLGLAEVVLALGTAEQEESNDTISRPPTALSEASISSIAEVVPTIEKARLYRGRGGEIMRSAACRLIECLSLARLPLTVRQQVRLLDSVDACLKHPSEEIQKSASKALYSLMRSYFPVGEKGPSDRLQKRVVDKYIEIVSTDDNPAATRGFALALGSLPSKLLAPSSVVLSSVLRCLCDASRYDATVGGEADAETRRNAIGSLSRICDTVGIGSDRARVQENKPLSVGLSQEQVAQIYEAFLLALQDYNTDRRGDVGSWSRMAAMSGLETLTYNAVKSASCEPLPLDVKTGKTMDNAISIDGCDRLMYFDRAMCVRVIGALLKQLSEKLDSVRSHAGECLDRMISSTAPSIPFVPERSVLMEALDLHAQGETKHTNWSSAATTFPMVMRAANIDDFFYDIISGMVVSVGGLTESVTKHATAALLSWTRGVKASGSSSRITMLGNALLELFARHRRDGRVILPLLKTVNILLSHKCLDDLIRDRDSSFAMSLFQCLKTEAKYCSDVHRLLAIVSLSVGLLSSHQDKLVHEEVLPFIFGMLAHEFPRVRRFTAEQLYMHLLEDSSVVSDEQNLEKATELLLDAPWDADFEHGHILEMRNKVADMVGISLPCEAGPEHASKQQGLVVEDEFETYASLVDAVSR